MGLAGAGRSIDIEEVPVSPVREHQGKSIGHFVAAADDEIVKTVTGVYRKIEDHLHGQKSLPCGPSGTGLPKWRYADLVAIRPRGVRLRKPCWIRKGS